MKSATTTEERNMGYTVFTRNSSDHSVVHIIAADLSDYFSANELARRVSGSVMFSDQFAEKFTATSPNQMNGTLR